MKQIDYEYRKTLVERQAEAEEAFLTAFRAGSYTIENPLIIRDPYGIAPLTALALFRTERPAAVTVTVQGKTEAGTFSHTFPPAREHILPILGLYGGYENTVTLRLYQGGEYSFNICTDQLPPSADRVVSMETNRAWLGEDLIFLTPAIAQTGQAQAIGVDACGDVRWAASEALGFALKRLRNGNIMIGTERLECPIYYSTGLYEMNLLGKVIREYSVPGAYHHDFFEMPDGNLLVLTEDLRSGTVEDEMALLSREDGEVLRRWRFKDFLHPGDSRSGSWSEADWFHNNAVWYDEKTDTVTLSGRHMDVIANINYGDGTLNWLLGDPTGWPGDMQKYFLIPKGEPFDWQYEQHACLVLPDGDIMCFDNGQFRSKIPEKRIKNRDNFSRGVRFRIDLKERTVRQIWEYGRQFGDAFFSKYISNVDYYADGRYLIHSGGIILRDGRAVDGRVQPGDPSVVNQSITVEISGEEVMLRLVTKQNSYRAKRIALYHDGDILNLGRGVRLGCLMRTVAAAEVRYSRADAILPPAFRGRLIEENDRFTFCARMREGEDALLLLKNLEGITAYRIPTGRNALNVAGAKDGMIDIAYTVNKEGLQGDFSLEFVIDGKFYTSGRVITC